MFDGFNLEIFLSLTYSEVAVATEIKGFLKTYEKWLFLKEKR